MRSRFGLSSVLALIGALLLAPLSPAVADQWESTVSPFAPGSFPELRPLRAKYNFGWNGVTAATADIRLAKTAAGRFELEATGGTIGFARSLWPFDIKHLGVSDARTLRPIEVTEVETLRRKETTTKVSFTPDRVTSVRDERKGSKTSSKTRVFEFPNISSLNSALLYLRTQPLNDGALQRIVIYPATSAYLATITVAGRSRITVPTGAYDAIKVDIQLEKIGKKRELQPHKKFKRASVWLSNDPDRLILRIEAQVFVGAVFAELQSVEFENGRP
ncbi:MAG: DUF3108 domain-containing protein [Chthoniobacterales bacterium]|nr:DUF3108 domain-containing protein [Chthoniobacterales bacterium]